MDAPRDRSGMVGRVHARGTLRPRGRLYRENVRGHLRYLSLHGRPGEAERARKMLRASLAVRGRIHRGEQARFYRDAAVWLGSGDVDALLRR